MCRNIKTLHNFQPPASELSGFTSPSKANADAFDLAVERVTAAARELIDSLVSNAPPRNREVEAAKAKARSLERFAPR
jgi:hypothetical protein